MNPEHQPNVDDNQPVAYDVQGRPLYYKPETQSESKEKNFGKKEYAWSSELQAKHDESVKQYPEIKFSENEYVVIDIQRTIWGLALIWIAVIAIFVVILLFATIMVSIAESDPFTMFIIVTASGMVCLLGGAIGQYVFHRNFFIITNERAFMRIQNTPFSHHSQNIELEHVEDCSYSQNGLLQAILNFGTIRLSTVGDEQTYRFTFVTRPAEQFKIVNHVVQVVDEEGTVKYRL